MADLVATTTPALVVLRENKIPHEIHRYQYVEKGGTNASSTALNVDEHSVVKTLIFEPRLVASSHRRKKQQTVIQDSSDRYREHEELFSRPFVVLQHGDMRVDPKKLALEIQDLEHQAWTRTTAPDEKEPEQQSASSKPPAADQTTKQDSATKTTSKSSSSLPLNGGSTTSSFLKGVTTCSPERAEEWTGYKVGGTSPFGQKRQLQMFLERSVLDLNKVYINGGQRGLLVSLSPADIVKLLNPTLVSVSMSKDES